MQPLGMRILFERDKTGEFYLNIPEWIAFRLGERLIMDYDGVMVRIWSVEAEAEFV